MNRPIHTAPGRHHSAVRLCAVPDHRRALRVHDGAGAEDLLLPRAERDRDVPLGVRRRDCERRVPVRQEAAGGSCRAGGCRTDDRVRLRRARQRPAVGAQGLGRMVAVGCAADVHADHVAGVPGVPAAAPLRRTRFRQAVGGGGGVRRGAGAVRLLVGEHVAHAASRPRTWCRRSIRRCGARSVLRGGVLVPVCACCCRCACRSRRGARGWKSCTWRWKTK